jgi:hypothetical protein
VSSTATYTGPTIAYGIYRANVSVQALAEAGVASHETTGNGGVQTLTIQSTRFIFEVHQKPPTSTGTLEYSVGRVLFVSDRLPACGHPNGGEIFSASWSF